MCDFKHHNQSSVFSIAVLKLLNKVAAGGHFACSLFDWLINDRKQYILPNRPTDSRGPYTEKAKCCDPRYLWCFSAPLWRNVILSAFLKREGTSPFGFLALLWLCIAVLNVTNCKSMAAAASADSNICSALFISWLTWRGKLKHLFAQLSTGFCLMEMIQSFKKKAAYMKRSHNWIVLTYSQHGGSVVSTSGPQQKGSGFKPRQDPSTYVAQGDS